MIEVKFVRLFSCSLNSISKPGLVVLHIEPDRPETLEKHEDKMLDRR